MASETPQAFGRRALLALVRHDPLWFERRGAILKRDKLCWAGGAMPVGVRMRPSEIEARTSGRQELVFPFTARELVEMARGCNDILAGWIGDSGRAVELKLRVALEDAPEVLPLIRAVESVLAQERAEAMIEALRHLGHDPQALAPSRRGLGPRAEVRQRLLGKHPFVMVAALDHTWQQLISDGRLMEV